MPLTPPCTDWLRHDLAVSGPAAAVSAFAEAARGCGAIPWRSPDLDREEEDRLLALLRPPDGSPGLPFAAARALACALRDETERHEARVTDASGCSRVCPLDLHALLPVPETLLARGPADPASLAWLQAEWGVVRPLRRVELAAGESDRRLHRSARLAYEFHSADWTPWAAIASLRRRWPEMVFDVRPVYR